NVLHPDDRETSAQRWNAARADGRPFEIEYRLRRADGCYRWFLGRALPVRDAQGRIVRWFGTCTDIDDRKQAEVERERLLASTAVCSATAGRPWRTSWVTAGSVSSIPRIWHSVWSAGSGFSRPARQTRASCGCAAPTACTAGSS